MLRGVLLLMALSVLVAVGGYCWTGASRSEGALPSAGSQPNIILILTDDMDAGLINFMGNVKSLLIDEGITFPNFFFTTPTCCPSRATILRGQYTHNHQILWNTPPAGGYRKFRALGHENSTIATWLQAAGYRTALFGKYLNGYPETAADLTRIPPGWDRWYAKLTFGDRLLPCPDCRGYERVFFNYQNNENGRVVNYGSSPADYEADVMARQAVRFIEQAAAEDVPFFMYLSPFAPHLPAIPAPRHENRFPNAKLPRPLSFNEADVSDKPEGIRSRSPLSDTEIAHLEQDYRRRLRSILAVDEMIAKVFEALQATHTLENTFIFFSSDNGYHMGQHRLAQGKTTLYEEDIRVPLIVRGPKVPAGAIVPQLVANTDLAPTFAELAGAAIPSFVDGRSLVPLMDGKIGAGEEWRRALMLEQWRPALDRSLQGLRTREYKYVEGGNDEPELYYLPFDPYELDNLYRRVEPSLVGQLAAWLDELRHCVGEECRAAENGQIFRN
jgi:N-acetylglucosamine-6-sulfatase